MNIETRRRGSCLRGLRRKAADTSISGSPSAKLAKAPFACPIRSQRNHRLRFHFQCMASSPLGELTSCHLSALILRLSITLCLVSFVLWRYSLSANFYPLTSPRSLAPSPFTPGRQRAESSAILSCISHFPTIRSEIYTQRKAFALCNAGACLVLSTFVSPSPVPTNKRSGWVLQFEASRPRPFAPGNSDPCITFKLLSTTFAVRQSIPFSCHARRHLLQCQHSYMRARLSIYLYPRR
ncbi:hypothetical protein DENSPDRAFT_351561 [Dentipellis sp. KUC8613]|nr:hypothetical protein DENSPDRAFT_351561 [Dentipellis sp. KUC8613]